MLDQELDLVWSDCGSGQFATALSRLRDIAERLGEVVDPRLAYRCQWLTAWTLFRLGETEEAFAHAQRANDLASSLDLTPQAKAAALSARLASCLGLPDESYALATSAVDLAERSADQWTEAFCLYTLSITIWSGGDPDAALPLSVRAVDMARTLRDSHLISWLLINHACILAECADVVREGDELAYVRGYEQAIDASLEACDLGYTNSDTWAQRTTLANAAEFYAYLGRFAEAHTMLDRWNQVQGDNAYRRRIHYLATYSDVLYREGRLEEARDCSQQALDMVQLETDNDQLHVCMKVLSKIHEAMGDHQSALNFYKQYHKLEQQFEGEKVKRRARVAAIFYESEKLRQLAEEARARADASEKEAATDPLSGVANRRHFERRFDALLAEGRQDFALVIADLDHFKSINDRFSHAVGDEVIKAFAQILVRCCRQDDLVARIGGEEFVMLLAHVEQGSAVAVCDRVLEKMSTFAWPRIALGLSVTTSMGLAQGTEASQGKDLLALADARLYTAKRTGRNRVVAVGPALALQAS